MTHLKRPWCWERLKVGGEGDDRGWDGWIASPTWWTWVWESSGSWWWTGKPSMLQSMGLQSPTQLNWIDSLISHFSYFECDWGICNFKRVILFAFSKLPVCILYPLLREGVDFLINFRNFLSLMEISALSLIQMAIIFICFGVTYRTVIPSWSFVFCMFQIDYKLILVLFCFVLFCFHFMASGFWLIDK